MELGFALTKVFFWRALVVVESEGYRVTVPVQVARASRKRDRRQL